MSGKNNTTSLNDKQALVSRIQELEQLLNVKEEEVERLKASFLSNVSHEIRTPMNAIVGFSNLLKDNNITEQERISFIDCINQSSHNLLKLIENLILTAKSESEKIKIKECEVIVNELLEEIVQKHNNELSMNGMQNNIVIFKNNHKKKLSIVTDRDKLKTIISNLIDNALKFSNKGQVLIGYNLVGDEEIQFFVKDSGIGIPQEKQQSIFNKFTQIEESRTKSYGGLGLGLTVSKNLVKCLGGNMSLSSMPGKGSVFTFAIPYKAVAENKETLENIYNNRTYTLSEQSQTLDRIVLNGHKNIKDYTLFSYARDFRA